MDVKKTVKSVLKRFHLFSLAKRVNHYSIEKNKRVKEILDNEVRYSFDKTASADSITGELRLKIHGIEKNMVKSGRNFKALEKQCFSILQKTDELLSDYTAILHDCDIVLEAIAICKLVLRTFESIEDCKELESNVNSIVEKYKIENHKEISIRKASKSEVAWIDFSIYKDFIATRHSIRHMSKETIEKDDLKEIVEIALRCPSACNRQPTKVYFTQNSESIRTLFPDPAVTKDIYNILVVTVNKSFYSANEVLEPWIDGGIFLESLILALHAHQYGACLFQCLKGTKKYTQTKQIVGIPDNEDIVAFVGYGKLSDEYPIIETHRKSVDEALVEFAPDSR